MKETNIKAALNVGDEDVEIELQSINWLKC